MTTAQPEIASHDEFLRRRGELLELEKEATRQLDRVAAARRRLPMEEFDNYVFVGPEGEVTLLELFGEHDELVLYQFMDRGPDAFCPGCTWFTDNVPNGGIACLDREGVAWATVSNMPLEQIERYKKERGWTLRFVSSNGTTFMDRLGNGEGFTLNVFLRRENRVFRTYTTTSRGVDRIVWVNGIQDLLPFGRKEKWEDSPEGWPQR